MPTGIEARERLVFIRPPMNLRLLGLLAIRNRWLRTRAETCRPDLCKWGGARDARSIHHHRTAGGTHRQRSFEGLTTFDAHGKSGPGSAESWTISEGGKVYTFKIRPDAKWSDGRPLTARDFVESWKRTLSPETAASYNYQLFYVKNAQAFAEEKSLDFSEVGVKALDDQTLEVTLENPTPFF